MEVRDLSIFTVIEPRPRAALMVAMEVGEVISFYEAIGTCGPYYRLSFASM